MEFITLPSQGAGQDKLPSESKKDADPGFEEALERALAESGLIVGVPSFPIHETHIPIQNIEGGSSEYSERPDVKQRKEAVTPKANTPTKDDLEWKALKPEDRPQALLEQSQEKTDGNTPQKGAQLNSQGVVTPLANETQSSTSKSNTMVGSESQKTTSMEAVSNSARPGAPISSSSMSQRILHIITQMNDQGEKTHRALLRLQPGKLGTVEIDIRLEDGRLSVRIAAMDDATRQMMEAEINRIRAVLEAQGFEELSLQLETGKRGSGGDEKRDFKPGEFETEIEELDENRQTTRNRDGLIDLLV
jgi:flagellar hook-length control protein FliK